MDYEKLETIIGGSLGTILAFLCIIAGANMFISALVMVIGFVIGRLISDAILTRRFASEYAKFKKDTEGLENLVNYNPKEHKLRITGHHNGFRKTFSLLPYTTKNYSYADEKIIYTSATVGGVTTGGFDKVGGNFSSKNLATDRYSLMYVYDVGGTIKQEPIHKIVLGTDELVAQAKSSNISEYLKRNTIIIVDEKKMDEALTKSAGVFASAGVNFDQDRHALALGINMREQTILEFMPTAKKCNEIISWLAKTV